nr:hypothetical protein [Tanacetum cinerariifolium]
MDRKKNIVDLEAFREMLHISPRVLGQSFDELPFKEVILDFLRFLGHSAQIKTLTDVVSRHQNTQQYGAILPIKLKTKDIKNTKAYKEYYACAIGEAAPKPKASARRKRNVPEICMQELWATAYVHQHSIRFKMDTRKNIVDLEAFWEMLHISPRVLGQSFAELRLGDHLQRRNVDYAFLIWEDFVYQVEHKNKNKSNEMYYPRFTKVIIHHFMTKKPSIPRRNKVNWHYVRDDILFSTIEVVSRHQNTQQYRAILPIELTTKDIRNTNAYKEYYACAIGEAAPKIKASARRKRGGSDSSTTPPTAVASPRPIITVAAPRLTVAAKGKQPAKATSPTDPSDVERTEAEQLKIILRRSRQETHISQQGGSSTDEGTGSKPGVLDSGEGDAEETESDGESEEEETKEEEEERFDLILRTPEDDEDDGNGDDDQGLRISKEERIQEEEEADELYRDVDINQGQGLQVSQDIEDSHVTLTPVQPDGVESIFMTASSPISPLIATITTSSDAPIPPTTIPSTVLENLPTFDLVFRFEDRVKSLEVNFSEFMQTNQFVDAISKIPGNKSIQRSDEQRNLYKALVDAYEADKTILESYGNTAILKRRRRDDDDQEGPSAGSDRGSKRRRKGGEHESASTPSEPATRSASRSTTGTQSRQMSASESAFEEEPLQTTSKETSNNIRDWNKTLPAIQGSAQTWISDLAKQADSRSSFNELLDTLIDFSNFIMNWLCVDTLTPELMAGPTFELMRGSCTSLTELEYHLEKVYIATTDQLDWVNPEGQQYPHNLLQPLSLIPDNRGRRVILFEHFINNDLECLWGGASSWKYTTSVTKTKAADYGHIKWIEDLFYGVAVNRESALDVYSKRRIIAVTDLKIVEWHNYKHIDWISVRRDDNKIYKFKEDDFKRLRLQDIKDMLLLLIQGKLSNLTFEERFSFNVSLRMFTRSIVVQRRVEDLQLGVESYQKRLNLTKPDTYRSDLKRHEAYTAYSNPRGFIYQNKDKKNRLMRIDEIHKFSDGTLIDVRSALDDRLKGIRIQYLPQAIWRKGDKDRAAAMIQSIDKMLKTRRIMRSLERFVGGRL